MKIEYLKRGTPIWVRGYVDGVGNIDFLDSERNVDELDWLIKDDIYYMSDSDFRLDEPDIDQPKPEVPQFVADWLEGLKKEFPDNLPNQLYHVTRQGWGHGLEYKDSNTKEMKTLYNCRGKIKKDLVNALIYGYTVKKEKLYTIEIPNPNIIGNVHIVLVKNGFGQIVMLRVCGDDWRTDKGYQITESEIRKDFEWAWQFAKLVEVE
ncbi:DUF1642 domain-containing protein [Streptococcus iniae]|uniref:DUF1642 domain-containing protein n=1 Tax=Streptococcus iniae TaxID=1346 RepID=UPI000334809C|nr:DUF1642 domain-containing protein [Streptococcus iniae]AGM99831.1 hypothetical protein K710_2089 [Streptococcus iniae SF1]QBX25768.1 hypothetical protein Javan272_0019 [Streptococcus phage Javan272]ASL35723.1 phage protein [Streptococcus iniae]ELY5748923.1 DUF1642 domain-containing protein [Streptococcus iniae]ELY5750857.1 DUF1642 domain-containing protein [Streptococcus iniae]